MKQFLLFIFALTSLVLSAQTNTFTGAIDTSWNNPNNWSLLALPGGTNNVVIPSGTTAVLNTSANIQSIQLAGTAVLVMQGNLSIAAASTISASSRLTWNGGNLDGGGTLNNLGTMQLLPAGGKQVLGGTTINNSGIITEETDWAIELVDGTLNNMASGVIELKSSHSNINASGTGSHLLNNLGLIKMTGTGNVTINAELHNSGTIAVESGTLVFNNPQSVFTAGVYNTSVGTNLIWSSTQTLSGMLTGNNAGEMHWAGTMNVPVAATFNFTGNGLFNWGNGRLTGGGVLNNPGLLSLTGAYYGDKYIENGTTLNNTGTIQISTDWSLNITDGTLNNLASGVIDFNISQVQLTGTGTGSHILNNAGLIKKTIGLGGASILAELHNTGTISVESGNIFIGNSLSTLEGGTYNVASGSYLFNSQTVTCSGTLTGLVNGGINWTSDINVPVAATFDFSGNGIINWAAGAIKGGGTLTNLGVFEWSPGWVGNRFISESTTLLNLNTIKVTSDQTVVMNGGTINNAANALFDIYNPGALNTGTGSNTFNNFGTLKKSTSTGTYVMNVPLNNTGAIEINAGAIAFNALDNMLSGKVSGTAAIQLHSGGSFTNNGTFAPGGEPGTLTVVGSYVSTPSTRFKVQLYGLTQGSEYDSMLVQSNAVFSGIIEPELHFAPAINDSFIIATTWGTMTLVNMASTVTATFSGFTYTFSVNVIDNNKLVLKVTNATLASDSFESTQTQVVLWPNPANEVLFISNRSEATLHRVLLIDCSGRVVKDLPLANIMEQKINIDVPSGSYLLKISTDEGELVKHLIVR